MFDGAKLQRLCVKVRGIMCNKPKLDGGIDNAMSHEERTLKIEIAR